jgi:hypothetical protein
MPLLKQDDHQTLVDTYFRYARIDAIDAALDTADITLLDGQGVPTSTVWLDVPIYYHCTPDDQKRANGAIQGAVAAFVIGDTVRVRFEDGEPLIMGLKDGLRACLDLMFFYDPVKCYDAQGNEVSCGGEASSTRTYNARLVSDWSAVDPLPAGLDLARNKVCTSGRSSSSHGWADCRWQASKTYDTVTAHAIRYFEGGGQFRWTVAIDVSGRSYEAGSVSFNDQLAFSQTDPFNVGQGYKAFDVFEYGGDIYVTACGDAEQTLHAWNVTAGTKTQYSLGIRNWFQTEKGHTSGYANTHFHLMGCYGFKTFWMDCSIYYGSLQGGAAIYQHDALTGAVTEVHGGFFFATWDEFDETIKAWEAGEGNCQEGVCTQGGYTRTYCRYCVWVDSGGYWACYYDCEAVEPGPPVYDACGKVAFTSVQDTRVQCDYHKGTDQSWTGGFAVWGGQECDQASPGGKKYKETTYCESGWGTFVRGSDACGWDHIDMGHGCQDGQESGCVYYIDWLIASAISRATITPSGAGFEMTYSVKNGAVCPVAGDQTTETSGLIYTDGSFNEDYAESAWPYYRPFAILKEARDRQQTLYTDIFAVKGDQGIEVSGQLFQGSQFFFVR